MKKLNTLTIILFSMLLTACSFIYRQDIQQGNVLDDSQVAQIKKGMPMEEVKSILGPPILTNTFNDHILQYVYTFQPGHGEFQERKLLLYFSGDRLNKISRE